MKSSIFDNIENTNSESDIFVQQNDYTLLVNLSGLIYAIQGSMVAYKGDVHFDFQGAGFSRFVKSITTKEGMSLMKISGRGDVYLANQANQVHIVELENEAITVNSKNVLAFTEAIDWDINLLKAGVAGFMAGGLFNTTLKGTGSVAITSMGTPIVIAVHGGGIFADINAIIAWSTSLNVSIKSSFKAQSLIGRGSGESFQMQFEGEGYIVVQPGEFIAVRS